MKAYFNHAGLAQPHPNVVARVREAEQEFAGLLYSEAGAPHYLALLAECRRAAAAVLGVGDAQGISLNSNATMGVNIALSGLGSVLKAGDIVVTSSEEHPCVVLPLRTLARMRQVEIVEIAASSATAFVERMGEIVAAKRPGLVIVSHVSYKNGRVLPVEEIGAMLAAHEIPYIVDGAQALGQIRVELPATRAWAYVFSGHKWLGGPMGTGGIWTSDEFARRNQAILTMWDEDHPPPSGGRFECGSMNAGLVAGLTEACRACAATLEERVAQFSRMRARVCREIDPIWTNASSLWEGASAPAMVSYLMPPGTHSWDVALEVLRRFGVAVKPFRPEERTDAIRISFSPWTTDAEIELLIEALRAVAGKT